MSVNPVLAQSDLPYGLPDFATIDDEDFLPAFTEAMTAHRAEVDRIAADPAAPTFDNTVAALELAGQGLARAAGIFYNLVGPDSNPRRNEIAKELAGRLSEHDNVIAMNPLLFQRISALHEVIDDLDLTEAQRRLLADRYRRSVRAGAGLDEAAQAEMRDIAARLAVLTTTFSQQVLDDTNASAVYVADAAGLDGLSDGQIAAARRAAADAGHDDGYLITLDLPSSQEVLTELRDPQVRRQVFDASLARCSRGNSHDTREAVLEIVRLRARRAELLGYPDHAAFVIAEQTAPDAAAVEELLGELSRAATDAWQLEAAELSRLAGGEIGPADVTYWLAARERDRASADLDELRDYLELDAVLRDGVFYAAGQLYGLRFVPREDLRGYHPDVRIWEVLGPDGAGIGLFLGDFYARPSKRGGAWMNTIVDQSAALGDLPVVVNVLNLTKPEPGQPCLLSVDALTTLFHEFGHTLHGLLSAVDYPSQSGTSVPRDFVEFPSQVNEMWALHPEVLANYARHHRTGEAIPAALAAAARESAGRDSAHATVEYLAASLLDLAWHRLSPEQAAEVDDVAAFEAQALAAAGLDDERIPPRYRSAYFNHIFGGGYSAGYYSYIWSEILDAETEQWFLDEGGLRRESGRRFAEAVLSRGDSVDPLAATEAMLGRAPSVQPLLRRRGLAVTG